MKLRMKYIVGVLPSRAQGEYELEVDCKMNEGQMFDALLTFLESLPGEKWEEWKKIIDESC